MATQLDGKKAMPAKRAHWGWRDRESKYSRLDKAFWPRAILLIDGNPISSARGNKMRTSMKLIAVAYLACIAQTSMAGQFPASGVNPNPANNPNPNSRLISPYSLDAENGELTIERGAAGLLSRALVLLHDNGQAILGHTGPRMEGNASTSGLACVGDLNFKTTVNCLYHLDTADNDIADAADARTRDSNLQAAKIVLGILSRIPNAANNQYLSDSLVKSSADKSRFFIEKIDCWWSLGSDNYKCSIKSAAFKR